ncbi:tRNA lysidine(34) synthetase TilS [Bacillus sp. T33-2]|uniref:tRNA lysidine(34) synthetase TilS n=1 Tax=Bacillus sp. T33-2 TaxID=2054168 RepID=UPI000C75D8DA|nr:tRNA lysidine(34) synthetase TilS [Bacillus sp. T33-2]PLR91892.1 tRNA lysidine(34) synthetase TilS [Bacillus sp. T33-2]
MLDTKVNAFIERNSLQLKNLSLAVGVSGGPDSLALLHFLWEEREKRNLQINVLHVDHMFRGQESYDEALFVKDFCEQRNIPFYMKRINVAEYADKAGLSSQNAARECRYHFFEEMMNFLGVQYLVLGHHGDDQVETVLMRLTRGSTGKARAGIPFSRSFSNGCIIRPFLCLSKSEIEAYCEEKGLDPRRDPSNEKDAYSRNRFRKRVLPFLKEENPLVHEHFQRFSEELQMDEDLLAELTRREMNKLMVRDSGQITIEIGPFREMPMPLQRRGIKLILNYLYQERPASLSALHIEKVFSIICNPHPSATLDFPNGLKVVRSYGKCHFQLNPPERQTFYFEIDKPQVVQLPNGDVIDAKYGADAEELAASADYFFINSRDISLPIKIRTRQAGDRMTLKGMAGSKKIKDIFIDSKIPVAERDAWPVVTDPAGKILWLPGLKKSNVSGSDDTGEANFVLIYKKASISSRGHTNDEK